MLMSWMPLLSLSLFSPAPAHAADCDVAALTTEAKEGPPLAAARAFVQLGSCDAGAASSVAGVVLPRLLSGDEASQAAVKAIQVGAASATVSWLDQLQPDERARTLKALGEACPDSEAVQGFFVERASVLGEDFWGQRWYRAIGGCKAPALEGLLWGRIENGPRGDRTQFSAVLEAWARASGQGGLERLGALLEKVGDDAEAQVYVVSAFADAAGVGSVEGVNTAAAAEAVSMLQKVAPTLDSKGVEQARITVMSLGDEAASDELAATRYRDTVQGDGRFLWGVAAVESATCKNGKASVRVSTAPLMDRGVTWADQIKDRSEPVVRHAWALDLAEKCKGEGTVDLRVSDGPFADEAAYKAWADKQVESAKPADGKFIKIEAEPLSM